MSVFDQRQCYLSLVLTKCQKFFKAFTQDEDAGSLAIELIEECLTDERISTKVMDNLKLVVQGSRAPNVSSFYIA